MEYFILFFNAGNKIITAELKPVIILRFDEGGSLLTRSFDSIIEEFIWHVVLIFSSSKE